MPLRQNQTSSGTIALLVGPTPGWLCLVQGLYGKHELPKAPSDTVEGLKRSVRVLRWTQDSAPVMTWASCTLIKVPHPCPPIGMAEACDPCTVSPHVPL